MKKGIVWGRVAALVIMLIVIGLAITFFIRGMSPAKTVTLAFDRCYGQDYHYYELEITKSLVAGNEDEAYKYYKQFKTCQTEEKVFTDIEIMPMAGLPKDKILAFEKKYETDKILAFEKKYETEKA